MNPAKMAREALQMVADGRAATLEEAAATLVKPHMAKSALPEGIQAWVDYVVKLALTMKDHQ